MQANQSNDIWRVVFATSIISIYTLGFICSVLCMIFKSKKWAEYLWLPLLSWNLFVGIRLLQAPFDTMAARGPGAYGAGIAQIVLFGFGLLHLGMSLLSLTFHPKIKVNSILLSSGVIIAFVLIVKWLL